VCTEHATSDQKTKAVEVGQEAYLAMLMLDGANYFKFRDLPEELDNDFAKGTDTYLMNHNVVLRWMNSQKQSTLPRQQHRQREEPVVMFAQKDGGTPDTRTCFRCGQKGHITTNCPAEKPRSESDDSEHMHTMRAMESDSDDKEHSSERSDESDYVDEVDGDDDACYFFHITANPKTPLHFPYTRV
jgi:hypothetical protein